MVPRSRVAYDISCHLLFHLTFSMSPTIHPRTQPHYLLLDLRPTAGPTFAPQILWRYKVQNTKKLLKKLQQTSNTNPQILATLRELNSKFDGPFYAVSSVTAGKDIGVGLGERVERSPRIRYVVIPMHGYAWWEAYTGLEPNGHTIKEMDEGATLWTLNASIKSRNDWGTQISCYLVML